MSQKTATWQHIKHNGGEFAVAVATTVIGDPGPRATPRGGLALDTSSDTGPICTWSCRTIA